MRLTPILVIGLLAGAGFLAISIREPNPARSGRALSEGGPIAADAPAPDAGQPAPVTIQGTPTEASPENDRAAALDEIRALPDSRMRELLLSSSFSAWASEDVAALFRYIATVDDWDLSRPGIQGPENIRWGYSLPNDSDFRALAALVNELSPPFDRMLRRSVIQGLARQDSAAAARLLETVPDDERREVGSTVATAYARSDPAAAFAWAGSTGESRWVSNVLHEVGENDPLLALDLALQTGETEFLKDVAQSAIQGGAIAPDEFGAALLALPGSERKEQALETMVQYWAVRDPDRDPPRVLEWLLAQGEATAALPQLFRAIAGSIFYSDLEVAASDVERIPPTARAAWIQAVAGRVGTQDPVRAAEWIEQYRGEPAYGPSMAELAFYMVSVSRDGPGAADLLRRGSVDNDPSAVSRIARAWAGRGDSRAAIDWAGTLTDERARRAGLQAAAGSWMYRSPDDAVPWALSLPSGQERDAILYSMISASFITETDPGDTLFVALSTDDARQVAAANAARTFSERDNETVARRLLDLYVTDSELRRRYASGEALPSPN